jgi:hypothetical protein
MKIIVTHASPDWDAIGSVWIIKKYLAGWQEARVEFVPAGQRLKNSEFRIENSELMDPIEKIGEDEVIHVDTGLGPLDHHQTSDKNVCGMSRTWDYARGVLEKEGNKLTKEHTEAISRIVKVVVDIDHFGEMYWGNPTADYHEFSLLGVLDGLKYVKQDQDSYYVTFGMECLDAMAANFENRIWAEAEIEKGVRFTTRYGKGIGFETINDTVLKLAQKMGYVLVVRKDPRKKYVRIKTVPDKGDTKGIDLTLAYEQLKKIDPEATWYLHVSKKMLLNGTPKNPKMRPTKLELGDIIKVLERI